ncbi:hypothetical protein L204_105840 [Cryptococcus depauperatus]
MSAMPVAFSAVATSRSSSLAGKKRPRELDADARNRSRRTKSIGDAGENGHSNSQSSKDREAFQRSLIAVFVPKALHESKAGNMEHYNDLLSHFLPTHNSVAPALSPLLPLLRAVSANISLLEPGIHAQLITAILGLPWATGDERFVKVFIGWAAVLVSAQPAWAKEVVGMAVKGLTWQTPSSLPSSISRRTFHARHHLLLSHLLSLVPTLPSLLQPLLIKNFPNKREPEVVQTTWVRNCCELVGYCPELGSRVWGECVGRMLRIDVEITNTLEQDEESEPDSDSESSEFPSFPFEAALDPLDLPISSDIPHSQSLSVSSSVNLGVDEEDSEEDPDPDDLSSTGDVSGEDEDNDEPHNAAKEKEENFKIIANVRQMRRKLDGMLVYFFQHLEEYMGGCPLSPISAAEFAAKEIPPSGSSTPSTEIPSGCTNITSHLMPRRPISLAQSLSNFQTLLNLFSRQILPTSSTQHIPFLLFLTSSFSSAHTDLFLGLLVSQALYATAQPGTGILGVGGNVAMGQRIAATVYIGSVVCRARFVSDEQARTVLTYLLAYIDGKLQQSRHLSSAAFSSEASKSRKVGEKIDELPLFYAVCQSCMLIFCFRWRAFLAEEKEGEGLVEGMELEGEGGEGEGLRGKWMMDLDILQRAITSELNPLLGCNPTIVSTFAKVAHHTNFVYCFSIIEANQQPSHLRSLSTNCLKTLATQPQTPNSESDPSQPSYANRRTLSDQGQTRLNQINAVPRQARQFNIDAGLDSYFPFDPYDLPRSKKFIDKLYRTWDEVAIDDGLNSDEEDSDDDDHASQRELDDEESELSGSLASNGLPPPKTKFIIGSYGEHRRKYLDGRGGGKDGGLSTSMEGMSISPGRLPGGINIGVEMRSR